MLNIKKIKELIHGPSEDGRFEAFLELFESEDPKALEEIHHILTSPDPVIKIKFLRFLSHAESEKSLPLIVTCLKDKNPIVINVARKVFEKNTFPLKFRSLLPFLNAPHDDLFTYAVKALAQAGITEIIEPLFEQLKRVGEERQLIILSVLRWLPEERMIPVLLSYLKSKNDNIRYKTLMVFGSLLSAGHSSARKHLLPSLKDNNASIRQAVLWCLKRAPSKKDYSIFLNYSQKDPDPLVRQEALIGLSTFPPRKIILPILSLMATEKSRMVLLKGEGLLLGINIQDLESELSKALQSKNTKIRERAQLLMSELGRNSESFCKKLLEKAMRIKSPKERLTLIEALGNTQSHNAIAWLETLLNTDPLTSYAAISALLKIWGENPQQPILKYLQHQKSAITRQNVLKHLVKKNIPLKSNTDLEKYLMGLLEDANLNIRYLATQALLKINSSMLLHPLMKTLLNESDPTTFQLLRQSILSLLAKNPQLIGPMLKLYYQDSKALHTLINLMSEIDLEGSHSLELLIILLSPPFMLDNSPLLQEAVRFILIQYLQDKIRLEDVVESVSTIPQRDLIFDCLYTQLENQSSSMRPIFSKSKIETWLHNDCLLSPSLLRLLALSQDEKLIAVLVQFTSQKPLAPYKAELIHTLNRMIWQEACS